MNTTRHRNKSSSWFLSHSDDDFYQTDEYRLNYDIVNSEYGKGEIQLISGRRFQRSVYEMPEDGLMVKTDRFEDGSVCEFVRLSSESYDRFLMKLPNEHEISIVRGVGWLFRSRKPDIPCYWIPVEPAARNFDTFGRILDEKLLRYSQINLQTNKPSVVYELPQKMDYVDIVVWTIPSDSALIDELSSVSSSEMPGIYLWGSHTQHQGPRDLYKNLIYGAVYKNDWQWPQRPWKTAYCETDSHAFYIAFRSLLTLTGKKFYQYMKDQLVFSAVARQEKDGAWRHGLWIQDHPEIQYRIHCSAIHMLLADYEETKDNLVYSSLKKAVDYLKDKYNRLQYGAWYLHDNLERDEASIQEGPSTFQRSHALGKSVSNMLVLNTHLDSLVALRRYEEITGEILEGDEVSQGVRATVAVLDLKPAELFYSLLLRAIESTFFKDSAQRPLSLRSIRRLAAEKLILLLPLIKKRFPRLVMPNGYIDYDLARNAFVFKYFPINVWDLLRFQLRFNINLVDTVIEEAIGFIHRVGLDRWLHDEFAAYAVAFWAEAMYIDCLRHKEKSRSMLAQALTALIDSGQGLPPSLLGSNPEYIPIQRQVHSLWIENDQIAVVNLSTSLVHGEFLLVNGSETQQKTSLPGGLKGWELLNQNDKSMKICDMLTVPARGWIRLISKNGQMNESGD